MCEVTVEYIDVRRFMRPTLHIPVWIVDSGKPGNSLLVTAAQHGNEVQGSVAIMRFVTAFRETVTAGKMILIPFCNLPAIKKHRPHLHLKACSPYSNDRGHNMNRQWGDENDKNSTTCIVQAILNQYAGNVKYVLDIHCWQKHKAPAILLHALPGHRSVAEKLGAQFIDMRPVSIRTLAGRIGTEGGIGITYECSGQYEINDEQVQLALNIIRNMAFISGISKENVPSDTEPIFSDKTITHTVTAECSGLFIHKELKFGDKISQEDVLGEIVTDSNLETVPVIAPESGLLYRYGVSRPNCDVDIASFHPFVQKKDILAEIKVPEQNRNTE